MYRKIIAIVLLFLIGVGIYYWSNIENQTSLKIKEDIHSLNNAVNNGNIDKAREITKSMEDTIDSYDFAYNIFANNDYITTFNTHLKQINNGLDHYDMLTVDSTIIKLEEHMEQFESENSISIFNVFE